MNQLRKHKQRHSLRCAVCPGLVCPAPRHLSTWPVLWSAGFTGWKLSFCQLLHGLVPEGHRKSRIPSTASRNGLSPVHFSYRASRANPTCYVRVTKCLWTQDLLQPEGCALSVVGNGVPCGRTQQHWVQGMIGLGEMAGLFIMEHLLLSVTFCRPHERSRWQTKLLGVSRLRRKGEFTHYIPKDAAHHYKQPAACRYTRCHSDVGHQTQL